MTPLELQSFYSTRKHTFEVELSIVKNNINSISNIRLVVAGTILLLTYLSWSQHLLLYVIPLLIVAFILLVKNHSNLFAKRVHLENLVKINSDELQSLHGDFSCFNDGAPFIDHHHPYTHDLDIFGSGSIFQYINRSTTRNGEKKLAASLVSNLPTQEAIIKRQNAVKELALKTDFRQNFAATGKSLQEGVNDQQQLLEWINHQSFLYGKVFYSLILKILPVLTVGAILGSAFVDVLSPFALLCVGLQWTILSTQLKKVNKFHQYVSQKKNILDKYARLLHLFGQEQFESVRLLDLSTQAVHADKKVKTLASLVSSLDARLNFMTNMFVNSLFLYDLQYIHRLEKWKEENAPYLEQWMDVISEIDLLCSVGTFSFNHEDFIFPTITTEQKVTAHNMAHPLIDARERVANDITLGGEQSILIITGANMAGKSTFLRTLGVNIVLALNGAPVCATSFSCPIIQVRSGMRTADSLQDHQSYFYAELNRLKNIMDELRAGTPLLILLDEILKGTNSTDKQAGSIALVKQLLSYNCMAIVATHDLALGDLEKKYPNKIKNYCFEPTIENDQLSFDYKLKTGLAEKMNATFLMRKMGIIPKEE